MASCSPAAQASATLDPAQGWIVTASLTEEGLGTFNQLAAACSTGQQTCPGGAIAIVLDGAIQSAPRVAQSTFQREISISGRELGPSRSQKRGIWHGSSTAVRSRFRCRRSRCRPCPRRSARTRCGRRHRRPRRHCARARRLAFFYRRLIVVVLGGLVVWGMLIYSAAAIVSQTTNYALSLAGVTGDRRAVGVTVDSYVVYFERLKDEVRHGRTLRNSAARQLQGDVADDRQPPTWCRCSPLSCCSASASARCAASPFISASPPCATWWCVSSSPARQSGCSPTPDGSTRVTRSA